ncbi:hypothetical protein SAMN05216503_1408 [Polaribacter sp. KT25b]|uniref:hypothetical protein n=1 Tax=Polaribacter sp. KT25b TaxID=1855336 RepID=UPI0008794952|nr:hypothetical protein [Polaribacter sp. KT25b]SDR92446.1 hypothetical protein SAMN05216503_1408 [Polaribacter sp. KT25b]
MRKILIFTLIISLFTSCLGDKKSAVGTNFNDTSFENKKFKTKVVYADLAQPCSYVVKKDLAQQYNVSVEEVLMMEGNSQNKICTIRVKLSDDEYNYLVGSIRFYEEKDNLEDGSSWVESWQLQKGISKSGEWIPNLGKAALWIAKKRELRIKFKDYTMALNVPGAAFNKQEKALNRDYKKIALTIVKDIEILN